jgi:hypothetical protein
MDTPPVADDEAADIQRLRHRRSFDRGERARLAGKFQTQLAQAIEQSLAIFEMPYFWIIAVGHGGYGTARSRKTQDGAEGDGWFMGKTCWERLKIVENRGFFA